MHLSPHWGPEDPSGVQSSLCVIFLVHLSLYWSSHPIQILVIISAARNCAQCMRPQSTGSNPQNGSIICLTVCLSVHLYVRSFVYQYICLSVCIPGRMQDFWNVVFILILVWEFSNTMHLSLHWGSEDCSGVQSSLYVCPPVFMSQYTVVCVEFWWSLAGAVIGCSACGHTTRGQIPWVALYYFYPSIHLVIRVTFAIVVFILITSVGGP